MTPTITPTLTPRDSLSPASPVSPLSPSTTTSTTSNTETSTNTNSTLPIQPTEKTSFLPTNSAKQAPRGGIASKLTRAPSLTLGANSQSKELTTSQPTSPNLTNKERRSLIPAASTGNIFNPSKRHSFAPVNSNLAMKKKSSIEGYDLTSIRQQLKAHSLTTSSSNSITREPSKESVPSSFQSITTDTTTNTTTTTPTKTQPISIPTTNNNNENQNQNHLTLSGSQSALAGANARDEILRMYERIESGIEYILKCIENIESTQVTVILTQFKERTELLARDISDGILYFTVSKRGFIMNTAREIPVATDKYIRAVNSMKDMKHHSSYARTILDASLDLREALHNLVSNLDFVRLTAEGTLQHSTTPPNGLPPHSLSMSALRSTSASNIFTPSVLRTSEEETKLLTPIELVNESKSVNDQIQKATIENGGSGDAANMLFLLTSHLRNLNSTVSDPSSKSQLGNILQSLALYALSFKSDPNAKTKERVKDKIELMQQILQKLAQQNSTT